MAAGVAVFFAGGLGASCWLMELIVLNVGLDMGVLSPRLFAMFVLMALVTTFGTTPILNVLMRASAPSTSDPGCAPASHSAATTHADR